MRKHTYYDASGNQVSHVTDMQGWQWTKEMPTVKPIRCRGHKGLPFVAGWLNGNRVAAVRAVAYKVKNPSLHKCGARCRNAKGPSCECECGGKYHGADA